MKNCNKWWNLPHSEENDCNGELFILKIHISHFAGLFPSFHLLFHISLLKVLLYIVYCNSYLYYLQTNWMATYYLNNISGDSLYKKKKWKKHKLTYMQTFSVTSMKSKHLLKENKCVYGKKMPHQSSLESVNFAKYSAFQIMDCFQFYIKTWLELLVLSSTASWSYFKVHEAMEDLLFWLKINSYSMHFNPTSNNISQYSRNSILWTIVLGTHIFKE